MLLTIGVVLLSLVNIFLATFALVRNSQSKINRAFAAFGLVTAVWMVANYLGANFKTHLFAPYFTHIDFLLGPWIMYTFWLFTHQFLLLTTRTSRATARLSNRILAGLALAVSVGSLTTLFIALSTPKGVLSVDYGPLFPAYGVVLLVGSLLGLVNLLIALKKSSGHIRLQLYSISVGMVLFVLLVATPNLVVPLLTTSARINLDAGDIAYLGIVAFVAMSFLAIVKHRLFDMRIALIRSVAFLISLSIFAALYSLLAIGASVVFIGDGRNIYTSPATLAILFSATFVVAITFRRVQDIIVRLTHRTFHQEYYDLRQTLDELSDELVARNEVDSIMQASLDIISSAIRPRDAYFFVFDESGKILKKLPAHDNALAADIGEIRSKLQHFSTNLLVIDDLPESTNTKTVHHHQISLALWLGDKTQPRGLILFGPKESGRSYTGTDVGLLTIVAKNLKIALDNAIKYEQISRFADTLRTEVDQATSNLRRVNSRLKTLDSLKNDFMSMASHQLRSPATSVHEALHMLNHPALSAKDREELIALAEANSERLVTVVKTMLNMARLQAGRFTIDRSEEDIVGLAEKIMTQTGVVADERNIDLSFKKPKHPVTALVDAAKITEAMANYVENAIKYSEQKSQVRVELRVEDDKIIFEVTDSGMGVPESERKNLFGKFYRATNARTEEPDGNGIGLYVVRNIARGHGGDSYYKPSKPGSLFGFWIPLKRSIGDSHTH